VQAVIDGSDPNVGTLLRNATEPLLRRAALEMLRIEEPRLLELRPRVLYNEEQKSSLFFIPGLMALLLILISTLLTSLTLTREKERGTLEQLLVSPLHPLEIIAGKIVPYFFLALLDGIIILIVGYAAFGVRVSGSLLLLAFASLIYIAAALSLGIFFSTVAKNQQQAMFMSLPITLLPTMLLSGFIFPISSMPLFLKWISCAIPATYYLKIIRGVILKGVGWADLYGSIAVLCGMSLFLLALSVRKFRVKL
jgi:ABC-2 type transport system permease protein